MSHISAFKALSVFYIVYLRPCKQFYPWSLPRIFCLTWCAVLYPTALRIYSKNHIDIHFRASWTSVSLI